ncbi:hypothetical protein [Acrocarpospora sp. B8E8]|uniref:hypothetical protein n=1 Tax=Acrocarpospora sp. B8E8 TaxID=3153572 RepID=UPI00325DAA46
MTASISWRTVAGDLSPLLGLVVALAGWSWIPLDTWWAFAFAAPASVLMWTGTERLRRVRAERDNYRAAAVALVCEYDLTSPDAPADSLDYIPADVLAEARKPVEVAN